MINRPDRDTDPATLLRWAAAAAAVIAVHGVGLWIAVNWESARAAPGGAPMYEIDLEPFAAPEEAPPQDVPVGPQMAEAEPEPEPPPVPEPDPEMPELPQRQSEEAVIAQVLTPPPEQQPPTPEKREPEKKPIEPKKPRAKQTSAPKPAENRADRQSAPAPGDVPNNSRAPYEWKSDVMARLNRNTRFPPGAAGSGKAFISFSISRSGSVLSARLARSSGDGALDQEAVALAYRAGPYPPPPPEVHGNPISLTVPVSFTRR